MCKLALLVLFFSIIFTSAQIIDDFLEVSDNDLEENFTKLARKIRKRDDEKIWVLSFNDEFEFKVLRSPNRREMNVFNKIIAPSIKDYMKNAKEDSRAIQKQHPTIFDDKSNAESKNISQNKKSYKIDYNTTNTDLKNELKSIINKFLFSAGLTEPKEHLSTKDSKQPNLKLFLKGPYCSLILESGRNKNHYFADPDSNLLPKWFYEEHKNIKHDDKGDFVDIPEDVKAEFYENFLDLLKTFLGFAI